MDIISCYKTLHRYPERSAREYQTALRIENWLTELGLEVHRIGETAVVGVLKGGKPGKTVGLRADIDALPITEQTGLPYASENKGVMHACGHDFHTAAVLGAAVLLKEKQADLRGTVKFIFQPDEEEDGYAATLAAHDILKDTLAVFGAHVDPTLPCGVIGIRRGPFYATAGKFDITLSGKSAHGATPYNGIDALAAGAKLVEKLLSLRSEDRIVSVGTLHSGEVRNIISDTATLTGICRVAGTLAREKTYQDISDILSDLEAQTGITAHAEFNNGYSGITNAPESADFVAEVAKNLFDASRVQSIPHMLMTTEDFGDYLNGRAGCFYHIGVGGNEGLHSSAFAPDPAGLTDAAALHAAVLEAYLNK